MATLATLIVKLAADIGGFSAEMEKAELKAVRAAERVGKEWKRAGDQLSGAGKSMTAAFTLPIAGGAALAVDAFSDLNESTNAVNVVFGDAAQTLHEFGQNSAQAVGLSTAEFNQLGAVTGAFLKNLGYDQAAAAEETINLTQRAADMASIFNTDVASAMQAIQSGLKGEFNPLEQFGVKLNAAAIEAKAVEMGLADATGEVSDAAKAQAALALIYEQTNQVAGDFANTSDGLANQTRIAKAEFTNLAASIGGMLMPYALQLLGWVREGIAWFNALDPSIQRNILTVLGIVAVLGPLLIVIGSIVSAIGTLIPVVTAVAGALSIGVAPLLLIIGGIIAVVALLYAAWTNNWGGIQEKAAAFWAWLQPILQSLWDWLSVNVPLALATLKGWWDIAITALANLWTNVLQPAIAAVWAWLSGTLFPFLAALANFLSAVFEVALTALAGIWENVLAPALQVVWSWLSEKLSPAFQWLADFWNETLQPVVEKIAEWIGTKLTEAFGWLSEKIGEVTDWLNDMADMLRNMSLPDWMTPGSPTPWEIGLRGVGSALDDLTGKKLPRFGATLEMTPVPAYSGMGTGTELTGAGVYGGGGAGGGTVFNINVVSDGVMDERDVARKIAGAVGVLLRERGLA